MKYGPKVLDHRNPSKFRINFYDNKVIRYIEPRVGVENETFVDSFDRFFMDQGSEWFCIKNENLFPLALALLEYAIRKGIPPLEDLYSAILRIKEIMIEEGALVE
jgi:hypothetical protein